MVLLGEGGSIPWDARHRAKQGNGTSYPAKNGHQSDAIAPVPLARGRNAKRLLHVTMIGVLLHDLAASIVPASL
jgi:hypothetical protein